jgi:hypothetical protein
LWQNLKIEPLPLSSIIFIEDRKITVIDNPMLAIGDRIRSAELLSMARSSARLVRKGYGHKSEDWPELIAIKKKVVECKPDSHCSRSPVRPDDAYGGCDAGHRFLSLARDCAQRAVRDARLRAEAMQASVSLDPPERF